MDADGGKAVIKDGALVISINVENLSVILEGAWAMNVFDQRYKVTDADAFAKELCYRLNEEDEQGTTLVHRMFDKAIINAIEWGAEGIDLHEQQEA
jgi:hypothetical protein